MNNPPKQTTIVQFSLRSLFVVTLIVAVASSIFAPRIQDANAFHIAALWLGPYIFMVGVVCGYRLRLEHRAGKLLFRCRAYPLMAGSVVAALAPAAIATLVLLQALNEHYWKPIDPAGCAVASGILSGWGTISLWWRSSSAHPALEFFERGVVFGRVHFRPWSDVMRYRWLVYNLHDPSRLRIHFGIDQIEATIHRDERDDVDALLTEHLKHFRFAPLDDPAILSRRQRDCRRHRWINASRLR